MGFARLLGEALAASELPKTGDVLAVGLPLFASSTISNDEGRCRPRRGLGEVTYDGDHLSLIDPPAGIADGACRRGPRPAPGSAGGRDLERLDQDLGTEPTGPITAPTSSIRSTVPTSVRRARVRRRRPSLGATARTR